MLDGTALDLSEVNGHPLLLCAGDHVIASRTRSSLGRYVAALHLHGGEDVVLTFRGGALDPQTGPGWGALATWNERPPVG